MEATSSKVHHNHNPNSNIVQSRNTPTQNKTHIKSPNTRSQKSISLLPNYENNHIQTYKSRNKANSKTYQL